jgi:hypothetical protein
MIRSQSISPPGRMSDKNVLSIFNDVIPAKTYHFYKYLRKYRKVMRAIDWIGLG